jgi:hypothetical protein
MIENLILFIQGLAGRKLLEDVLPDQKQVLILFSAVAVEHSMFMCKTRCEVAN